MQYKQQKRRRLLPPLSRESARVLMIGLPVILLELSVFTYLLGRDIAHDPVYALYRYPPMLEHIMMGLSLIVIGAFLFDLLARRRRQ